jgi:carbon monoxide dehydrogenase subunit G
VQLEVVAGLGGGAPALRVHRERGVVRAEAVHAGEHIFRPWPPNSTTASPPRSRSKTATPRSSISSGSCPAVEGGSVTEVVDDDTVKAEIVMRMGAMSMKLVGTVAVAEKDEAAHRAVLTVRSKEVGGTGHANAEVTFQLRDGGGDIHTNAQITGKAASMGEGVVVGVLDALIKDFTTKLGRSRAMARVVMRAVRPGRSLPTAAPRCRRTRTARCSAATAPTTTCACSAATCSPSR